LIYSEEVIEYLLNKFFSENSFKSKQKFIVEFGLNSWYSWKALAQQECNEGDLEFFGPEVWEILNFE
jgi:hypothetical protein